jgi:hypothetical protein
MVQTSMLESQEPRSVRLEPPRRNNPALVQAQRLADLVRNELASLDAAMPFDEFMQMRRGRTWSL